MRKEKQSKSLLVVQGIKDPPMSLQLLWLRFSPWPGNLHVLWARPRGKKKAKAQNCCVERKKEERREGGKEEKERPGSIFQWDLISMYMTVEGNNGLIISICMLFSFEKYFWLFPQQAKDQTHGTTVTQATSDKARFLTPLPPGSASTYYFRILQNLSIP